MGEFEPLLLLVFLYKEIASAPCANMLLPNSTVVSHLYNSTVLHIAKVPGTAAYKDLFERLGNKPAPASLSRFAQWQRWWNKKRGLPATPDVGVLASLLTALRFAATEALAEPIDHVAVTRPAIPAITKLDLDDALEHAGLRGWLGDSGGSQPKHVFESQASFAGNNHGLCDSYRDFMKCWDDASTRSRHVGLFISLTRHALYASLDPMQGAFPHWSGVGPRMLDFSAGLDSRNHFASDSDYWTHIRTHIVELVRQGSRMPDMLLLGGENGTERELLTTIRDAVALLKPAVSLDIDTAEIVDPTFAAARGMAFYARRRQEAPGHCVEWDGCDQEREKQRDRRDQERIEL